MSVRKTCPRCQSTSTNDAFGQQYWGVKSKVSGNLICRECGIEELYERMFTQNTVDKNA